MAELIDKGTLIDEVGKIRVTDDLYNSVSEIYKTIKNAPTTTEAEIRNRAIDEFAEKLKELVTEDGTLYEEYIDEIADQLKEE